MSKLSEYLAKNGTFPPVTLTVRPIDSSRPPIKFNTYISYEFHSSIVVPVDTFQFSFKNPEIEGNFLDYVQEGDLVALDANNQTVMEGFIDAIDISTTLQGAEIVTVVGRDLMGQLEDQSPINDNSDPIWGNKVSIQQAVNYLIKDTRIKGLSTQDTPRNQYLLATEPGESKLSSLQRFLEPLNCVSWMVPGGRIKVGRPNMAQSTPSKGLIVMDRNNRKSNVLSIKAFRSSTQIPNLVIPVWAGQESVVKRVTKEQGIFNASAGPARLRKFGHKLAKAIPVSTPGGADPQSLAAVNDYIVSSVGGGNLLQAHAKREIARANLGELTVQVIVKGHYNDDLEPFVTDTMYQVLYPRAAVDEKMYLFDVHYLSEATDGQKTSLTFCKLGTIVSDVRAR